jgi:hypothetical protein
MREDKSASEAERIHEVRAIFDSRRKLMGKSSPIFEETYRDYLKQIGQLDLQALAKKTGLEIQEGGLILPFFGQPYRSSAKGIMDASGEEPVHSVKVVLCGYLLLYPLVEPQNREWVSYKDFKEAAPFVDGFQKNTERAIARNFSGKLEQWLDFSVFSGGKGSYMYSPMSFNLCAAIGSTPLARLRLTIALQNPSISC